MAVLSPLYETLCRWPSQGDAGFPGSFLPFPYPCVCPCEDKVPCPGTVPGSLPVPTAAVALGLSLLLKPGLGRLKAGVPPGCSLRGVLAT